MRNAHFRNEHVAPTRRIGFWTWLNAAEITEACLIVRFGPVQYTALCSKCTSNQRWFTDLTLTNIVVRLQKTVYPVEIRTRASVLYDEAVRLTQLACNHAPTPSASP